MNKLKKERIMKKLFCICMLMVAFSVNVMSEEDPDKYYIRNSLYMIKLDEANTNEEYNTAFQNMNATFDTINFANNYERYNDFSLGMRHIDFSKLPEVTDAEKKQYERDNALQNYMNQLLVQQGFKKASEDEEYVAKLMKYFEENRIANKLVAKWHNKQGTPEGECNWDDQLSVIVELGLKGASTEALDNARKTENLTQLASGSENKLLTNSYLCVVRYGYADAKEYVAVATAAAEYGISMMPALAQTAAKLGLKAIASKIKGYFVRANAYLFQIDWNESLYKKFYDKYWNDPTGFMEDPDFKLKYVGKSSKYAPATLSLKKSATEEKLISRATVRGTDAAIAALQRDYENFRPMSTLHVIDGKLGSYIGLKEGVKSGDKFDVFELTVDEKTQLADWKNVGSIKVDKGAVWDNRLGAGEILEDEAEDKTDKDANNASSAGYTAFKEKPSKKIGDGCMIRLSK